MSSPYGIKISKSGHSVYDLSGSNLVLSSVGNTLKIKVTGTITDSLPGETIPEETSKKYTATYAHGLTGLPMYWPDIHDAYNDNYDSTDDFIVNDSAKVEPPVGPYSPWTSGEWCEVYIDSTNITLVTNRASALGLALTFGEHDVIYYYTIFYNRMDEEVDYT